MKNYTEDDVKILDDLEAVRKRPHMYIGYTDSQGLFHLFKELADNAIDEVLGAGSARDMHVGIMVDLADRKQCSFAVYDNGRGIPTGKHKDTGKSTLASILTKTHAGAKFGSDAYKGGSIGTHGVGLTVVNALSAEFEVITNWDGKWWRTRYEQGREMEPVAKCKIPDLPELSGVMNGGTYVCAAPDMSIMSGTLDLDAVSDWCYLSSVLNPGLTIHLYANTSKKDDWDVVEEFCSENGIGDLLDQLNAEEEYEEFGRFTWDSQSENGSASIGVSFVQQPEWSLMGFTNTSFNSEGGTHCSEFSRVLYEVLKEHAKRGQDFSQEDIRGNVSAVLNVAMAEPQFRGQTKEKLTDPRGKELLEGLADAFRKWTKANKEAVSLLIDAACDRFVSRTSNKMTKKLAKELKNKGRQTAMKGKWASCKCKPEKRELYIVEGQSAAGPAKEARVDVGCQEVLAIKGKIINASRNSDEKIIANKEFMNVCIALGFDATAADPYSKLRIKGDGKLVLLADPDPDGLHILLLLLTVVAKVVPSMLENGNVYIARIPEYYCEYKKRRFYGLDKVQLAENLKAFDKAADIEKVDVRHCKGLGEMPVPILREVAFDRETRMLVRVKPDSYEQIARFMEVMDGGSDLKKEIMNLE